MEAVEEELEAFIAGGEIVPRIPVIGAVDIVVAVNLVVFVAVGRTEKGVGRGQDQTVGDTVLLLMAAMFHVMTLRVPPVPVTLAAAEDTNRLIAPASGSAICATPR